MCYVDLFGLKICSFLLNMERKQLRTYNGKGRQKDVSCTAGSWNAVFGSPASMNNAQQSCTAIISEPVVKKNRQIRNRYIS